MTEREIVLVKNSFSQVAPIAEKAAELFYARLFELDPSLRALFHVDMKEQGRKLMSMLALVVGKLDRIDELIPRVQELGRRHAGYRVEDRHYDTVAAALLWTLEQGLGDAFTPEVKEAWTAAYLTLAGVMNDAAHAHPAADHSAMHPHRTTVPRTAIES